MNRPDQRTASTFNRASRRRTLRLNSPAGLSVAFFDQRVRAMVLDVCVGGIGLSTNVPLRRGVLYQFTLRLGRRELTCEARPVHCRPRAGGEWMVGLSFDCPDRQADVEAFVDAVMGTQIEFSDT